MADSFFGFDTSLSNLNDDEPGGEPSEDEYDALNDETFGQGSDEFDWEVEHEHLASQLESSRRSKYSIDDVANSLEASISLLMLDETDVPAPRTIGSSVWRHDPPPFPTAPTPGPGLKKVCTVEELERQLRQKQQPQQTFTNQNYFQPRFPPVILQRPPGLQAPVPLPFAPNQTMTHGMNQPLNKIIGQNTQINQLQNNHPKMMNHVNQMGQNVNQFMQNANQIGQYQGNQLGQNNMMGLQHQIGQNNQMMPQNQNIGQMGQMNQIGQGMNQLGQNVNQMNQLGQNINQNMGQMMPNGNQFGQMGQYPHNMMGNPRMMAPPPGMNMPRQNFNSNVGQYNPNFRGPMPKSDQPPMTQPSMPPSMQASMMMNQQSMLQQQMKQTQANQGMKPVNQSPQISQMNQSQTNKNQKSQTPISYQKLQKTRIYNNSQSNQKGLTSQNLVQMIQNTHPMLQFNNSFHNASHHPMLNRNIFTSNQHAGQFNQRMNGVYVNNRSSMNGDESICSDTDEYAGLMTQREKQWLINIQMLQLNTGTPYIHDFYYTVFLERQANKEKEGIKEAHKANQQNHPFYSGAVNKQESQHRERHNSVRHNSTSEDNGTPRTYVPQQFENSLGKLQCGSVTAPRKIIDVEVVGGEQQQGRASRASSVASNNPAEVPREVKRTKQLLLDIEALYLILLRLEELNDPLAISNALILKEREEKQKQLEAAQKEAENEVEEDSTNLFLRNIESVQRRKQDSPKSENIDKRQVVNLATNQKPAPIKNLLDEDKDDLVNKMFLGLLHGDRLAQMLTVRKGRRLVCRFLSRVCGGHLRLRGVWARVLRALPHAARRDDGGLAALAHHYRKYIQNSSGWSAILESCSILSEAFDPARTPYALTTSFTLSCVCALVESASALVNTPEATANERQWSKFLKTLARALKNTTLTVARPVVPLPEHKVLHHLKQIDSRTTIEILQRGKTTTEFADLTKNDVTELLVKYLC